MSGSSKKILYVFERTDWQSRLPVATRAAQGGYEVVLAPAGENSEPPGIPGNFREIPLRTARRISPAGILRMASALRAIIKAERPDIIHAVTLKYAFVAGLAAFGQQNTRTVYTLAGLGYLFRGEGGKARTLRGLMAPLLRRILNRAQTRLIFQNPDDLALMAGLGFAKAERSVLVPGSGVDLEKFRPAPEPANECPLVLMPTRLVREKGLHIFAESARILKERGVDAVFRIAGGESAHNPSAVSKAEMESLCANGALEWIGYAPDMPALLASAALIVYPSYYGEGIPRVLLEACAAGRAIVTTDHPGCREAVTDGVNGLLVPVKDAPATAAAIAALLADPARRQAMGAAGRERAVRDFAIETIAAQTVSVYNF